MLAWFADGARFATLRRRRLCPCIKSAASFDPGDFQIIEIHSTISDQVAMAELEIEPTGMAASDDHLLIVGVRRSVLVDASAHMVVPKALPRHAHVEFTSRRFVVVAEGAVLVLDPHTAEPTSQWAVPEVVDATAFPHGIVAVDSHHAVRIACVNHRGEVQQVAATAVDGLATHVQVVGSRIAVSTNDGSIQVAPFHDPCR